MPIGLISEEAMNRLPGSLAAALVLASLPLFGTSAQAAEGDAQKIVISLQSDPLTVQEPACVALQLGTGLKKSGADVTIFATLDGVGIANADVMGSPQLLRAPSKFCKTVDSTAQLQDPVPLPTVLQNYLAAGGKILACPLCWVIKFGDLPGSGEDLIQYGDQVYIATPIPLFLAADKVIDY
jgi:predicted peroxiredoxin